MKEAVAIAGRYSYLLRRHWFARGVLNSYGQVFFSNHPLFAVLLACITFIDFYTGLFGLIALLTAQGTATVLGMERYMVQQGYYGFNALLTGMGMGLYYQPGLLLLLLVVLAGLLALLLAVVLQGVIGKYGLPHLSLPFILSLWILMLASREFGALGLNERGGLCAERFVCAGRQTAGGFVPVVECLAHCCTH